MQSGPAADAGLRAPNQARTAGSTQHDAHNSERHTHNRQEGTMDTARAAPHALRAPHPAPLC